MRVALLVFLLACGKERKPDPVEPEGPVSGGSGARSTLDRVKVQTDLSTIRSAIRRYAQENEGAFPSDIGALGIQGLYYEAYYTYDASAGTVTCDEFPNL